MLARMDNDVFRDYMQAKIMQFIPERFTYSDANDSVFRKVSKYLFMLTMSNKLDIDRPD